MYERNKSECTIFPLQVKVLVPNSTAGMVIGKAGVYIRQIKEDSGAYVQISQKSKDLNLPERCVTIAGMHMHNNRMSSPQIRFYCGLNCNTGMFVYTLIVKYM